MDLEEYLKTYIHRYDREPFLDYFNESDFLGLVKEEYTLDYRGYKLSGGYFFYPNYIKDELVIFCNGIGSGYVNYMTEIATLARAGYKVLDLDLLGDFNSPGESIRALSEALAILDCLLNDLSQNEWYKKTRIMVVGHSLGGYAASNILHFHPEVKNIVAISPFMSIESLASHYGGKEALAYELKMNPLYACKSSFDCLKETNSHVLIVHSIDDKIVSYEENTGFLKANINNPNVSFLIVDKKGHNPNYTEDGVAYMQDAFSKLFNSQSLSSSTEALLWKQYDGTMTPAVNHFVVGYIQRNGGGNSGFTRSMVESFLMQDGTPIYASSDYQGDKTYENVAHGRDPRLLDNVLIPGDLLTTSATMTEAKIDKAGYYYRAPITEISENRCPTGYSIKKGLTTDPEQGPTLPATTASVVFRAAEAYLNYMEADCELNNGNLDANSMKYWEALRTRGGIAPNTIQHTIDLTDVTKENDLARYSGENLVSSTLYNIRRERRIELAAEGLRFEDLKRWRSLDMMQNYHVQGFNLWDENYKRYATPDAGLNGSNFDAPLNVIALKESGAEDSNVSAKADGVYMMPYRILTNNIAFNGYNWNPNKYLNPIAFDHFRLTTAEEGSSDYTTSVIYQNPGWKIETNSLPEGD